MKSKENQTGQSSGNKNLKYILIGAGVILVAAIAVIIYMLYSGSFVATIGSEKVSATEFKFFLDQQKEYMLQEAGITKGSAEAEQFWSTKIEGEDALVIAKRKAMESIKDLKIQVAIAKEKDVKLEKEDEEYIDAYITQLIGGKPGSNEASEGEKAFKEYYGVTIKEFTGIYRQFVLATKLAQKEMEGVKATEEEIKAYYEAHLEDYTRSQFRENGEEAVWARHILIPTINLDTREALPAAEVEAAKKQAEELLARAKNGEDFIKLVKENSKDAGSAESGGDYIFGKNGYMMKEFEETAFSLKPGEIALTKTDAGYHIIKLEEKIAEGKPVSFECAKGSAEYSLGEDEVLAEKYSNKVKEWNKDPKFDVKKNDAVYNSIN